MENRRQVRVRRVDECNTLDEIFRDCLPAFGGAYLRRIYLILDRAIGAGCPLTISISGPVTVSGQHQAWLIPLLETGWIAYMSTTDAVCYHDGHRSLNEHKHGPVHEVPIFGDDRALREEKTIRVTDMAFDEDVLLERLEGGHLTAACFDVFAIEPAQNDALLRHPNMLATPHMGAAIEEVRVAMFRSAIRGLVENGPVVLEDYDF